MRPGPARDSLAGNLGEFVNGVDEDIMTNPKLIALPFDACGEPQGSGYDAQLIDYLRKERFPFLLHSFGIFATDLDRLNM